jgi:hypothetical protein
MSLKCVYVSGAYTVPTPVGRQRNINRAWDVASEVWSLEGAYALCPHCNTANMDGAAGDDYEKFMQADLDMVERLADAMVMVPGWKASSGARREREAAMKKGIPVFDLETYAAWINLESWLIKQRNQPTLSRQGL